MSRNRNGGRILPHDRDTNDTAPSLGMGLNMPIDLIDKLNENERHAINNRTCRNYRNRIQTIIKFLQVKHPMYCSGGGVIVDVPENVYKNKANYLFLGAKRKFTKDLKYIGLDMRFILSFMFNTKYRIDAGHAGKLKSVTDLRNKYKDAILFGTAMVKEELPKTFYTGIENFLKGYAKEFVTKKKANPDMVEYKALDPINISLYCLLLKWMLEESNVMGWHWTQCQWSLMARGSNIDPLTVHKFTLGTDSIICKYDGSKCNKSVGRLAAMKYIFANPLEWKMCYWIGFGIYTALRGKDRFTRNIRLFSNCGIAEKIASNSLSQGVEYFKSFKMLLAF